MGSLPSRSGERKEGLEINHQHKAIPISTSDPSSTVSPSTMPLFRKQSSEKKKRLQHQLYLARESPDPNFDISGSEISEIPSGVFSLCKVLQKEALILHNNWLSSLKGGGQMKDLETIRILDLHDNEITVLPDDSGHMQCLQVLNMENNKLKALPVSLGNCHSLQTLNLKGNKLKELPAFLCSLKSLRTMDISNNHITSLPKELFQVRTLETLVLDASHMRYPSSDICSQGTEAIMKYLCSENGVEYIPPSKVLLDVLDTPRPIPGSTSNHSFQDDLSSLTDTIMQYESLKEKKRQERVALERQLEEDQRLQAQLAAHALANKDHLIQFIAEDQHRLLGELTTLQKQKETERNNLVTSLYEVELSADQLVQRLLEMNAKAKHTEELMEQMEKERMEAEQWFVVHQEEAINLREQDIFINMEKMLSDSHEFEAMFQSYMSGRDEIARRTAAETSEDQGVLEAVLGFKQTEQGEMVKWLLKEEDLQKEAFEALQLSKDAKHQRLTNQIELVQQELAQLTTVELEQRKMREDTGQNILEEKRRALMDLMMQLMHEREGRKGELKKRLIEMEEQRSADQIDYWLVQFQRLMDRKPQALIDQERQLEFAVIEVLEKADATDYVSTFARHRISIETLCSLNEDDLKQMGVHELGLRKNILREINAHKIRVDEEKAAMKLKLLKEPAENGKVKPSAPWTPTEDGASGVAAAEHPSPTAPPAEVTARGLNTECVICMDDQSVILFLNCGHVCCCPKCAQPLAECPLCRAPIVQRIRLAIPYKS